MVIRVNATQEVISSSCLTITNPGLLAPEQGGYPILSMTRLVITEGIFTFLAKEVGLHACVET
jgi:hypothetical protein